jgi:hypothetical protein
VSRASSFAAFTIAATRVIDRSASVAHIPAVLESAVAFTAARGHANAMGYPQYSGPCTGPAAGVARAAPSLWLHQLKFGTVPRKGATIEQRRWDVMASVAITSKESPASSRALSTALAFCDGISSTALARRVLLVDPKHSMLVGVERDRLAVPLQIGPRRLEIIETSTPSPQTADTSAGSSHRRCKRAACIAARASRTTNVASRRSGSVRQHNPTVAWLMYGRMGRPWTAERVKADLVELFRRLPNTPVIVGSKGELFVAFAEDVAIWDMAAVAYCCLGEDVTPKDRERRLMLLTWARCMAMAKEDDADASMHKICAERGWNWQAFQRTHQEAAEQIACMMGVAQRIGQSARRLGRGADPQRT